MSHGLRMLHWVLKTGDRTAFVEFLHELLDMHALRHEEFEEGCKAACNGPYDGKWSKTMMGYGDEASNFVLELTYTYGVRSYDVGNDLGWIKIKSRAAFGVLAERGLGRQLDMRCIEVASPGEGYRFLVVGEDPPPDVGPMTSVCLNVSDLGRALDFWVGVLGFLEIDRGDAFVALSCAASSATLRLHELEAGEKLRRGTGYGRLALACPTEDLEARQEAVAAAAGGGAAVLTPLTQLDTPGKASVAVVIVADPDGHEVCLVGEEGFRRLARTDEAAPQLLGEAIAKDSSNEWFEARAAKEAAGAGAAKGKGEDGAAAAAAGAAK